MSDEKKKEIWNSQNDETQDESLEETADKFVRFLKDSGNKKALKDFIIDTYKKYESEKIESWKARIENERQSSEQRIEGFHTCGNIAPLLSKTFNMNDSEKEFVRGLQVTKKNLTRALEDKVDEINRLLKGIGGFSAQLKSCFARSTVVFFEQDDPKYPFRERIIFSIHLPAYELKGEWKSKAAKTGKSPEDGRSDLQITWDSAVNALAGIIETAGLKPRYCKNDKNLGRFEMKQDLRRGEDLPDEYFSIMLDYNTVEKLKEMSQNYKKITNSYSQQVSKWRKKLNRFPENSNLPLAQEIRRKYLSVMEERDCFVGTVPDPEQMEEGLLLHIEVSSTTDYHVVKDRMQTIMTRFILHLSKIALEEAKSDSDLEYHLEKVLNPEGKKEKDDLDGVPEYEIDGNVLKKLKKVS